MHRHARQICLIEVGLAGQARLASACAEVRLGSFAGQVAALYLAGAGMGRIRVRDTALAGAVRALDSDARVEVIPELEPREDGTSAASPERGLHRVEAFDLVDPAARELAAGALEALRAIRTALEDSPPHLVSAPPEARGQ
jgi:hypothetical protein